MTPSIYAPLCAAGEKFSAKDRDWLLKSREMQPRLRDAITRGAKLVEPILDNFDTERPILFGTEDMPYKVWVLSESLADKVLIDEPHIHITIRGCGEYNLTPQDQNLSSLVAFLPLKFDDCENPVKGFHLFTQEQAELVWKVVEEHKNSVSLIVVNCHAGLCRSSGVAAAVAEKLNGSESCAKAVYDLFAPNKHVYETLKRTAA